MFKPKRWFYRQLMKVIFIMLTKLIIILVRVALIALFIFIKFIIIKLAILAFDSGIAVAFFRSRAFIDWSYPRWWKYLIMHLFLVVFIVYNQLVVHALWRRYQKCFLIYLQRHWFDHISFPLLVILINHHYFDYFHFTEYSHLLYWGVILSISRFTFSKLSNFQQTGYTIQRKDSACFQIPSDLRWLHSKGPIVDSWSISTAEY